MCGDSHMPFHVFRKSRINNKVVKKNNILLAFCVTNDFTNGPNVNSCLQAFLLHFWPNVKMSLNHSKSFMDKITRL